MTLRLLVRFRHGRRASLALGERLLGEAAIGEEHVDHEALGAIDPRRHFAGLELQHLRRDSLRVGRLQSLAYAAFGNQDRPGLQEVCEAKRIVSGG
ncbi:hypothetical protein EBU60_04445 [bacterium]|nr:hypothetical protein [bacterium]